MNSRGRFAHTSRVFWSIELVGLLLLALPAYGQGNYVLGTSLNLTGGGSRQSQILLLQPNAPSNVASFYGLYPSLSLTSMRPNSSLSATYLLGFYRNPGRLAQPPASHTATLDFSTNLGPRWSMAISDSFSVADSLGRVNAVSGGTPSAAGSSLYPFSAAGALNTTYINGFNTSFNWAVDQNSSLSFFGAHSLQKYTSNAPADGLIANSQQFFLADQQQFSGGMTFHQDLGTADSWDLTYRGTHSDYGYGTGSTAISQSGQASYSKLIGPSITIQIGAGLTQVNSEGTGKLAYDAKASIAKTIQSNTFSLAYTQDSNQQVGLGSTATTQRVTLDWNRTFGLITAAASGSAYQSNGILNNGLDTDGLEAAANFGIPISSRLTFSASGRFDKTRGSGTPSFTQQRFFATGNLGFALTTTLTLSGGLTFQDSQQTGTLPFNQERAFISLRYNQPTLLSFR